jgi:hypothetical protein
MIQESTGLKAGSIIIDRELWIGYKIYLSFLLLTGIWTVFTVLKAWYRVPPFRGNQILVDDPAYLKLLQGYAADVTRWLGLIFLAWGILAATAICRVVASELRQDRISIAAFMYIVEDLSASFATVLWVAVFLYLVRWHFLSRFERGSHQ